MALRGRRGRTITTTTITAAMVTDTGKAKGRSIFMLNPKSRAGLLGFVVF